MRSLLTALAVFCFLNSGLQGQEVPQPSKITKGHDFLKKFTGVWEVAGGADQGPQGKAVMTSRMLGNLWVVNSSDHEIDGVKLQSIQMIGYDPDKKKYVGVWADSMINYLWQYEGELNEAGTKLTLEAKGPSMTGDGKLINYRDAYEFKDDDTIQATSSMQNKDGKWTVFMTSTAKRKSKK